MSKEFEHAAKESVRCECCSHLVIISVTDEFIWHLTASNFLQTTLASGYPRLLRLFQEFFEHVGGVSGTVYSAASQSYVFYIYCQSTSNEKLIILFQLMNSPETILVLRAIQPFESLYLTRTTNRLNESISSAFSLASTSNSLSLSSSFSSASRSATIPTGNEGQTCARTIVNELDKAKFDPLLIQAVAKGVVRGIELFVTKSQALVCLARCHFHFFFM